MIPELLYRPRRPPGLVIVRLGENDLRGPLGTPTTPLDRTDQCVLLSSRFRRTPRSAALQLDVSATATLHDELLVGRPRCNLFSDGRPLRRW